MNLCLRFVLAALFAALLSSAAAGTASAQSAGTARPQSDGPDDLFARAAARIEARAADIVAVRHDIHRHPEPSGEEGRTAGVVARYLRDLGFEVRTGVGGHGVVGVLRGGRPGPTVAFRADMDAVRSNDPDPAPYRSTVPGIRHICGHDVHVAIGLATAEAFAAVQPDLPGHVMMVFQPAEETATGAKAMLADGAFAGHTPDAIYAVHTAPYEVGQLATSAGGMMAGRASYRIDLTGDGDLEAAVQEVQRALAETSTIPPDAGTRPAPRDGIFVQQFGGARPLPSDLGVRLQGQVMAAGPAMRVKAKAAVLAAIDRVDIPGVSMAVDYDAGFMLGVTNDDYLVERANRTLSELEGVSVTDVTRIIPAFSEDFGSFQEVTPGVMFFLGVSNRRAGIVGMPHTGDYVADDAAIAVGARAMTAVMLDRLLVGPSPETETVGGSGR